MKNTNFQDHVITRSSMYTSKNGHGKVSGFYNYPEPDGRTVFLAVKSDVLIDWVLGNFLKF